MGPLLGLGALIAGLLLLAPAGARAEARIGAVLAGANGDSGVAYVEIELSAEAAPLWGPQGGESQSRARLTFHDATGLEVDAYAFPSDPPLGPLDPDDGTRSVLVATQAFVARTGLAADYVMAARPRPVDGMVCFTENPANPGLGLHLCLAYGNYQGGVESDGCTPETLNGSPATALPIAGIVPRALRRVSAAGPADAFGCGQRNGDFALRSPAPRNAAGDTAAIAAESIPDQGRRLFARETFGGNGRTCATCHPPADSFGLTPARIAELHAEDPGDPLFVNESQAALFELENTCLLRMGHERGLVLENIDGFDEPPVFRAPPHLLNVIRTAPFGLTGDFADLRDFTTAAVLQHLPQTLARNDDPSQGFLDLRLPTFFELDALRAYMGTLRFPVDGNVSLDRMIDLAVRMGMDPDAIARGRELVTADSSPARCSLCHSGPVLAHADGRLGLGTGNLGFDIGLAFRPENEDDGCAGGIGDPTAPFPSEVAPFSTSPLVGVARTAPFFHDNSATTLREAVAHYGSEAFEFSEASFIMETNRFFLTLTEEQIDDIVVFLEAISVDPTGVPPGCGDGAIDADEMCDDGNLAEGDGCNLRCEVESDWTCQGEPSVCAPICEDAGRRPCDLNGDGFVDRADVAVIARAVREPAEPFCDARDRDEDGEITRRDVKICFRACDLSGCRPAAPGPACGLLGPELLPLLALARLRRRRAAREGVR